MSIGTPRRPSMTLLWYRVLEHDHSPSPPLPLCQYWLSLVATRRATSPAQLCPLLTGPLPTPLSLSSLSLPLSLLALLSRVSLGPPQSTIDYRDAVDFPILTILSALPESHGLLDNYCYGKTAFMDQLERWAVK